MYLLSYRQCHLLLLRSWERLDSGAFRVEMQRESQKDRTILCRYNPTEPGDYRVEVKWSGEHVPGSPFMVMIFDTQEELQNYLQVRIEFSHSHAELCSPCSQYPRSYI